MNPSPSSSIPNTVWAKAGLLARYALKEHLRQNPPPDLNEDLLYLEPMFGDGLVRKEIVLSDLLRILSTLMHSHYLNGVEERPLLSDGYRLSAIISLLECCNHYVSRSGERELFLQDLGGRNVQQVCLILLDSLWAQNLDPSRGLFLCQAALDGIEIHDASYSPEQPGQCFSCTLNLYVYCTLRDFLQRSLLEKRDLWEERLAQLGEQILAQFWRPEERRLLHAIPQDEASPFAQHSWQPIFPHGLALFLYSGLGDPPMRETLHTQLHSHMLSEYSGSLGMALSPQAPEELTWSFPYQGYTHVDGANHLQLCARSARHLQQAGYPRLAKILLNKLAGHAIAAGSFFQWSSPDDCPQGAPDADAALAFLNAWVEVREGIDPTTTVIRKRRRANDAPSSVATFIRKVPTPQLPKAQEPPPAQEERRGAQRIPLELQGSLVGGTLIKREMEKVNIRFPSTTGLSLFTQDAPTKGSMLRIQIDTRQAGGKETCTLKGKVVWTQKKSYQTFTQCGVEFLEGGDLSKWERFMEQKLQED